MNKNSGGIPNAKSCTFNNHNAYFVILLCIALHSNLRSMSGTCFFSRLPCSQMHMQEQRKLSSICYTSIAMKALPASVLPMHLFMANKSPAKMCSVYFWRRRVTLALFTSVQIVFNTLKHIFEAVFRSTMNRHAVSFWSRLLKPLTVCACMCDKCWIYHHHLKKEVLESMLTPPL